MKDARACRHGHGFWPDERTTWQPVPRSARRLYDGRVFPQRRTSRRAVVIDNISRFIQAGSEVSGSTGQLPSRMGYQSTTATSRAVLKNVSSAPMRVRLHRFRPFTFPPTISPNRPLSTCSRICRPRLFFRESGRVKGLIQRLIRCSRVRKCCCRQSSASVITASRRRCAGSCATRRTQGHIVMLGLEQLSTEDRKTVFRARRLDVFSRSRLWQPSISRERKARWSVWTKPSRAASASCTTSLRTGRKPPCT